MRTETAALRACQEKDEAFAVKWWNEHTDQQRLMIWMRIQRRVKKPEDEIILRFAQLGMTRTAMLATAPQHKRQP